MALDQSSTAKKKAAQISDSGDRSEFIPYHSHYNPHTLITKNGELLQVIKIDGNLLGQPCENLDGIHTSICEAIRHAINGNNVNEKLSFWLHTVRKSNPISYNSAVENEALDGFAGYVKQQWEKENKWEQSFHNEIYLTILYEGQSTPLFGNAEIKNLIFPKKNRLARHKYLDMAYKRLDDFTLEVLATLRGQCKATRLGLAERSLPSAGKVVRPTIFYSEPMEFLGILLNSQPEAFPLPDLDLSVALQTTKLSFGFNAIESRSKKTGKRRFSAMFSIKQYCSMSVEAVDCVLQAPIEFIISQSFSFIPAARAVKHYKAQKSLFDISGDLKANDDFGINGMFSNDRNTPVDFGEHQINIMLLVDDLRRLDDNVGIFKNAFERLGLLIIREDLKMEDCFWAQLPGNFSFIRRPNVIPTVDIGGFCRLNRFHGGNPGPNHWGSFLSIIPTIGNAPYFFNFHVQDNGHTVLFDFNSFDDRIGKALEYFLLTNARKFNARLLVFDRNQSARLWLNKLEGNYFPMTQLAKVTREQAVDKAPRLALNPFALEPSQYNNSFLAAWCSLIVSNTPLDEAQKNVLREAVERISALPQAERNLPRMAAIVSELDSGLARLFDRWIGHGEYAGLFDFAEDSLDMVMDMVGFDMTPAIIRPDYLLPVFSYLMHRVIDSIDGRPTIIVINEAWDLLENQFFAPRLESLLEMLRQRNVMVFITTSQPNNCKGTATLSAIMASSATQIYLPDELPSIYQSDELGINDQDTLLMLNMDRQKGDFLIKQTGESVALQLPVTEAEDIAAIFMNDLKALGAASGKYNSIPEDY